MSHAAIYHVTKALQRFLQSQLIQLERTAVVTLLPPGAELPARSGLNVYLYRVMESPFTRNQPWPGNRTRPPSDQPGLGLQLSYLLTPLSKQPEQDSPDGDHSHTMLGIAMLTLHEHPVLNAIHIPGFDADTELPDFLLNSYEQIKICLVPTGLEDLSKIWAAINQPYRLSVAYEVSLVELTPTTAPHVDGAVVTAVTVAPTLLILPQLDSLAPVEGPLARVVDDRVRPNDLQMTGAGLFSPGQSTIVRMGGQGLTLTSTPPPTSQAITVVLPTNLDAGPQADVRVTVSGRTSTPLLFTVRPWLTRLSLVRAAPDPREGAPALRLTLEGSGLSTKPQAVRFEGSVGVVSVAPDAGGTDTHVTVTLPPELPNGLYNVRVVLNDADASVSNARTLEVFPLLDPSISVSYTPRDDRDAQMLTLHGARLNGNDLRLLIDGVAYQIGPNENAHQLSYILGRQLRPGIHQVAVIVDGHRSRTVELEVEE